MGPICAFEARKAMIRSRPSVAMPACSTTTYGKARRARPSGFGKTSSCIVAFGEIVSQHLGRRPVLLDIGVVGGQILLDLGSGFLRQLRCQCCRQRSFGDL